MSLLSTCRNLSCIHEVLRTADLLHWHKEFHYIVVKETI